jgi:hypothetical protein
MKENKKGNRTVRHKRGKRRKKEREIRRVTEAD